MNSQEPPCSYIKIAAGFVSILVACLLVTVPIGCERVRACEDRAVTNDRAIAILQTDINHMKSDLSDVKAGVKTLVDRAHTP